VGDQPRQREALLGAVLEDVLDRVRDFIEAL